MSAPNARDRDFLAQVIALSQRSRALGRHPFAAMVVGADGKVIAAEMNASSGDRTAHAEMNALRRASELAGPAALAGATLYSSAEPCAMCAGGAYWAGVSRVVYALAESSLLALTGSDPENPTLSLPCREVFARGQRAIEVLGPALEDAARVPHLGFWRG